MTLLNPRRKHFDINDTNIGIEQIKWEHKNLLMVDAISFWFPHETLNPITLYELGNWVFRPKKLFIGCHPEYQRKLDVLIQTRLEIPNQIIVYSLEELTNQIIEWEKKKQANSFVREKDQPKA